MIKEETGIQFGFILNEKPSQKQVRGVNLRLELF